MNKIIVLFLILLAGIGFAFLFQDDKFLWGKIVGFPAACSGGQVVNSVGRTLGCIDVNDSGSGTDTNWQTSWNIFDTNMSNYFLKTLTAPLSLPVLDSGKYLTNNGAALSWATISASGGDGNVSGSGDINRLAYWVDSNVLGSSGVSQELTFTSDYLNNVFGFKGSTDDNAFFSI